MREIVCFLSGPWLHLRKAPIASGAVQAPAAPAAPKELHGFELVREQFVPEYNSHVMMYRHQKTGVQRAGRQARSAVAAELQLHDLILYSLVLLKLECTWQGTREVAHNRLCSARVRGGGYVAGKQR